MKKILFLITSLLTTYQVIAQQTGYSNTSYRYDVGSFVGAGSGGFGNGGFTIKTQIPYNQKNTTILYLKGNDNLRNIGLQISWSIDRGNIITATASSTGGWTPQITLFDKSGYLSISFLDFSDEATLEIVAFSDNPFSSNLYTNWEFQPETSDGYSVFCTNKFSEVWADNIYTGNIDATYGVFERINVGNSEIKSSFQVAENGRVYYTNRSIYGTTIGSSTATANLAYILLHPFATTTTSTVDAHTFGRLSAVGANNIKINAEINSSSKAGNNRASLIDYSEGAYTKLVVVNYSNVPYVAIEINSIAAITGFTFTGYAQNEFLEFSSTLLQIRVGEGFHYVNNPNISNPQPYPTTSLDNITFKSPLKFQTLLNTNNDKVLSTDANGNVQLIKYNSFWQPHSVTSSNPNTIGFAGTVYIGVNPTTIAPLNEASYKLVVDGKIGAKKVRVTELGWADYVFNKDYKLMPLTELERYIENNKHLPEVPTTNEVDIEGVDIGSTQTLLLKKIEELTLYIIEQNKKIENQNQQLRNQKQQINIVKTELSKISKKRA